MTNFSDGVRLGNAGGLGDSRLPLNRTFSGGGVQGVSITPIRMFTVVPVTGTLAALQTVTAANFTLSSAGGITTTNIGGTTYYDIGCARTLVFTGGVSPQTPVLMVITGKDDYLQTLTQAMTGPTGTGTAESLKAFRYVASVFASGNTTSTVSIAVGDRIGLPYCVTSVDFVQLSWAGTKVTASTGFSGAVTTVPSTSALGDVRGVYSLSSASDGVKRFTAFIAINDPDSMDNAYGQAQV
jgi:hypothetical protein